MSQPTDAVETVLVSPAEILLDPNSYRLVNDPLWMPSPDQDIQDPDVQSQTFVAIVGESQYGLRDLQASLKEHGWLDIEPLWVRRLDGGSFVAVDGNRRLAAWRMLNKLHWRHQLPLFPPQTDGHQILVHVANELPAADASLCLGLRHLQLPTAWPPLAVAVWRDRHREAHGEPPGKTAYRRFSRWRPETVDMALRLARRFAGNLDPSARANLFGLLLDALSKRPIASWLAPNDGVPDDSRVEQFLDWMALIEQDGQDEEGDSEPRGPRGRMVSRSQGVQQIAALLDAPDVAARLEAGAHPTELMTQAYLFHELADPEDYLHPWVDAQLARNRPLDPGRVQDALVKLREAVRRSKEEPVESGTQHPWPLFEPARVAHMGSLTVNRYRGVTGATLVQLQRINLLVGVNNAGKTSVLEAIYLLSRLSDPRGLLDTLRVRTRQDPERNPSLLSDLIDKLEIDIEVLDTDDRPITLLLSRLPPPDGADVSTHISGMRIDATVGQIRQATTTELSSQRPRRTVQVEGKSTWLAQAVLHSPYSRPDRAAIMRCYEESVEAGSLSIVVNALNEAVDPGLEDIRLVSESGRFVVEHKDRPAMDLSAYGEGLQRVFEIGLLFAAHRGGFVLIDELETAIHPGAMLRFTKLIQELAASFDVQVFITTHSKETVDAFLFNGFPTDDLAAYLLKRPGNEPVHIQRFGGPELKRAVEVGDVDLRRL